MLWFNFRKTNSDTGKKIEKIEEVQGGRFDTFLTKDSHGLLCENASLRLEKHVSTEVEKLNETLTGKMGEILTEIKNGR